MPDRRNAPPLQKYLSALVVRSLGTVSAPVVFSLSVFVCSAYCQTFGNSPQFVTLQWQTKEKACPNWSRQKKRTPRLLIAQAFRCPCSVVVLLLALAWFVLQVCKRQRYDRTAPKCHAYSRTASGRNF